MQVAKEEYSVDKQSNPRSSFLEDGYQTIETITNKPTRHAILTPDSSEP